MPVPQNQDDELAARFSKLGSYRDRPCTTSQRQAEDSFGSLPKELQAPRYSDDMTLDDLLAELGGLDEPKFCKSDERQIHDLLAEAENVFRMSVARRTSQHTHLSGHTPRPDVEVETQQIAQNDEEQQTTEDQEADEYIRAALEQAHTDRDNAMSQDETQPSARETSHFNLAVNDADTDARDLLPAVPTTPLINTVPLELPPSALHGSKVLPAIPTFHPSTRTSSLVPPHVPKPKFTDEEIETWCEICNDDATVRCLGCDGELYCAKCWSEGHIDEGVGMEERGHSWVKFVKAMKKI